MNSFQNNNQTGEIVGEVQVNNQQGDTTTTVTPNTATVDTAIASVSIVPAITETSNFQETLLKIPMRVHEAEQLLEEYRSNPDNFLDNIDDKDLEAQLKQLEEVSGFVREIDKSRKEIRKYLNDKRDEVLSVLDKRLEDASFGKLEKAQQDIRQLQKDVVADRAQRRWEELRVTFEANINRYPQLHEFSPVLTDFSRFKIIFPKLVSGARTRKIREADHTTVNETLYAWNTAVELIKENQWGLSPSDLNNLLNAFNRNPSIETVNNEGRQLKLNADAREKAKIEHEERMKREAEEARIREAKRQEEMARIQEQERIAQEQRNVEAQKQAQLQREELQRKAVEHAELERQRQAQYAQFGNQYKTIFKESFPQFIEYLFSNPNYHNVHTNSRTKASVVYDIMRQTENSNSIVMRETAGDPDKVLDLIRFILDA